MMTRIKRTIARIHARSMSTRMVALAVSAIMVLTSVIAISMAGASTDGSPLPFIPSGKADDGFSVEVIRQDPGWAADGSRIVSGEGTVSSNKDDADVADGQSGEASESDSETAGQGTEGEGDGQPDGDGEASDAYDPENFHREFDYKDDTVSIVASVDEVGVVPDEADFFCSPIDPKSDEYCELLRKTAEHYGTTEDRIEIYPYDMGFAVDGNEVEPEYGEVAVQFDFKKPIEVEKAESVDVLHVTTQDETKVVAEGVDSNGQVENVEIGLSKFSPVVIAKTNVGSTLGNPKLKSVQMMDGDRVEYFISKTSNIDEYGVANSYYGSGENTTDVVSLAGATETDVVIKYRTESTSYDWLYIKDSAGNIIKQDADGKQVGDSSGKIGGGGSNNLTPSNTVHYRFEEDELRFVWRTDGSVVSYGYYAYVTPLYISAPVPAYHFEELEDGTYALVFDQGGAIEGFVNRRDIEEAIAPYKSKISEVRLHKDTTSVDQGAFQNLTSLKKVTFPRNTQLERIGTNAFAGCDSLESISIPSSVNSISGIAFTGCASLESVKFSPDNQMTKLPDGLFHGLAALNDVTLPIGLTEIPNSLFDGCSSLREIDIPSGVTKIGNSAFRDTRIPEVPNLASITEIGNQAFANNPELTSVTIPATITSLGDAFRGCANITDFVFAEGTSFPTLSNGFFYGMSNLKNVVLPSDLTKVSNEMFRGCSALEHVDLPETVTSIGESAFYSCTKLQDFEIPSNVTIIGSYAFADCDAMKDMVIPNTVASLGSNLFYNCSNLLRCQFESGSIINTLPDGMFYGCPKLESVKLPDSVTTIPASYFRGCFNLRHVDFPESLTRIGDYAFYECYLLENMTFPDTLKTIGTSAFYNCDSITDISIPASVTSIGTGAFQRCDSLKSFIWEPGNQMTSLPSSMFDYCSNLETLVLPENITAIPNNFARYCSRLNHVSIPNSVKTIGSESFYGCSALNDINIPSGCTSIGSHAFYGAGLTQIALPDTLTTINQYAFYNTKLSNVIIPIGVSSIGQYAFSNITPLESVHFAAGGSNTSVSDYAFQNDYRLSTFVPNGRISYIGYAAFNNDRRLSTYTIGPNVTEVRGYAFNNDTNLRQLVIEPSPTGAALKIDNGNQGYVFGNLTSLEELTVNRDLTSSYKQTTNFINLNPNVHITIGNQVNNLDNMLISTFTHDTEITFVGENDFRVTNRTNNTSTDPKWSTLSGSFYVDPQGVLYKLDDATGTASLFYIPKGITSYTVPSTITSVAGNSYSVTHIDSYTCRSAENLTSLTFEDPSKVVIPQFAFSQCPSLRTINGGTELYPNDWSEVSLLCDFPVHTNLTSEQVLVLNDTLAVGDSTEDGTFSFGVSISGQESGGTPDNKTYIYPTGTPARLDVAISNESNVDMSDRVIRIYFAFTGENYMLGNHTPGDYTLVNTATGSSYPFKVRETDARGVYYYDITGFKPGDTLAFNNQFQYESPKSAGGEMRIWVESLSAEQAAEMEGKTSQPNKYILADWYTQPVPYRLTKQVYGNPTFQFVANQTDETDDNIYVKNLQYRISLSSTGSSGNNYAKDYIRYIDMEDELQLNENMAWTPEVVEAVRNQNYYYNSSNNYLYVRIGNQWVELCHLSFPNSSYVRNVFPKVVTDESGQAKIHICWSYRNQYWTNATEAPTADFPAANFDIYMGSQAVQVKRGSDLWKKFREGAEFSDEESEAMRQIANKVSETSHYSYSADQHLVATTPSRPVYETTGFSMTKTMTGSTKFGCEHAYDINLTNSGLVHKDDIDSVSDTLNTHYYIKAEDLESMLDDSRWGPFCNVDILSVTLCTRPNKHAVDIYGNEFTITDAQYSGADPIPYNGASPAGSDASERTTNAKLSLHWDGSHHHKVLEVKNDEGVVQQTYTIGANGCDYHTIDEALEAIGFIVTFRTQYDVSWDLYDAYTLYQARKDGVDVTSVSDLTDAQKLKYEYRLKSGRTDTFHIPSCVKRTDMFLVEDEPGHYPSSSLSSSNTAYARDNTDRQVGIANWSGTIYRELSLNKSAYANGQTFDNNIMIPDDTTIDYTLSFTNSGDNYEVLPLTDKMGGAQVLLVPVRTNRNALYYSDGTTEGIPLQDANLDTYTSGGIKYYVLDKTGNYKNVNIDGRITDTIQVTKGTTSATTLMIWYYQDVDGYVNSSTTSTSKSITYKALADSSRFAGHGQDENGSTVTGNALSNFTWLGGHQTHRLVDSIGGESEMLQFVKDIVEDPTSQHERLIKHSLVEDGDEVLYKITIKNTGKTNAIITGNRLRDELPCTSGLFTWSKSNILDITYVTERLGSSVETIGSDDWYVDALQPGTNADTSGRGNWYIKWTHGFKINIDADGEIWIYIRLKFPASTDVDENGNPLNTWDNFIARNSGGLLTNDFYIDQRRSGVTHELVDIVEGVLQKGVLDTGLSSSGRFQSEETRHYYQNGGNVDNGTVQEVAYYTTVYNSGNVRLYLDNLQDDLPKGFKFRGLFNYVPKSVETDSNISTGYSGSSYNYLGAYGSFPTLYYTEYANNTYSSNTIPIATVSDNQRDTIIYKNAQISASTSAGNDGRQHLVFQISRYSNNDSYLHYDKDLGKYYLNPGEAIRFGYLCTVEGYARTENIANNEISMPVYDKYGLGVHKSDPEHVQVIPATYRDIATNDGECDLMTTEEEVSGHGHTKPAWVKSTTDWFSSNVSLRRLSPVPGLLKTVGGESYIPPTERIEPDGIYGSKYTDGNKTGSAYIGTIQRTSIANWKIRAYNEGGIGSNAMEDYTIVDTVDAPYRFTGNFFYDYYSVNGTRMTSSSVPLFSLGGRSEGDQTVRISTGAGASTMTLNSTITINGDPVPVDIPNNAGATSRVTVQLLQDEHGNETIKIRFADNYHRLPPNTYMELIAHTQYVSSSIVLSDQYYNHAQLEPSVEFDPATVAQGHVLYRTEDGESIPYAIESGASVTMTSGYSSAARKQVTEMDATSNTGWSDRVKNSIILPGKFSKFYYDLYVDLPEDEPTQKLVLIDALPEENDHSPFVERDMRESEFKVRILGENPGFTVWSSPRVGSNPQTQLSPSQFTLEVTTSREFTAEDWEGNGTGWTAIDLSDGDITPEEEALLDAARSFRIVIHDEDLIENPNEAIMGKDYQVHVRFNGEIETPAEADPGEIAWNSFGYRYTVPIGATGQMVSLNAEPLKVGVQVPAVPYVIKDQKTPHNHYKPIDASTEYRFLVYSGSSIASLNDTSQMTPAGIAAILAENGRDFTVTSVQIGSGVATGQTDYLDEQKRWTLSDGGESFVATNDNWVWQKSAKYTILELPWETNWFSFSDIQHSPVNNYTFTQNEENNVALRVTNVWAEDGNLTLRKTVNGPNFSTDRRFTFTITLRDGRYPAFGTYDYTGINMRDGSLTFDDTGTASIQLKHDQGITLTGLPAGYTYQITESEDEWYTQSGVTNASGAIASGSTIESVFTNTRKSSTLNVRKTVVGNMGDKSKLFDFEVYIVDEGRELSGAYPIVIHRQNGTDETVDDEFVDGAVVLHLSHGDVAELSGLPFGARYEVDELATSRRGYRTESTNENGLLGNDAVTSEWTNTKDGMVPTLRDFRMPDLTFLIWMMSVVATFVLIGQRKRLMRKPTDDSDDGRNGVTRT